MTYLKWAAIVLAAWIGLKWLSGFFDKSPADIPGGHTVGRAWAAPMSAPGATAAWAPPYGEPDTFVN